MRPRVGVRIGDREVEDAHAFLAVKGLYRLLDRLMRRDRRGEARRLRPVGVRLQHAGLVKRSARDQRQPLAQRRLELAVGGQPGDHGAVPARLRPRMAGGEGTT